MADPSDTIPDAPEPYDSRLYLGEGAESFASSSYNSRERKLAASESAAGIDGNPGKHDA